MNIFCSYKLDFVLLFTFGILNFLITFIYFISSLLSIHCAVLMVELFQLVQEIRYLYGDQGEKEVKIGHCINGSIQRRQGSGHLLCAKDALSREVLMAQSEYGYDYSSEI